MTQISENAAVSSMLPSITRRAFVKGGGALLVSLTIPVEILSLANESFGAGTASASGALDPTLVSSWLEIREDNTILARTGRTETGVGMSAYYAQTIAEELCVRPESITLVLGDTDRTPDGGYSAGFLFGAENVRKVAAYTHQALVALASKQLGVPAASLSVDDGVVSGGGKTISYGQLVKDQKLDLKIPIEGKPAKMDNKADAGIEGLDGWTVKGDAPLKPVSQYKVVGTSFPMPGIPDKVTGKTQWSCDVRLPGMLHARMVRPASLGSTLISAGELDKNKFPNAEVIRKNNLVAVVSPDEWEAIAAARAVAASTKWTDWAGLEGSDNLYKTLRAQKWGPPNETKGEHAKTKSAMAAAAKTVSATYELPYVRHAPIGPFVATADVKQDGSVTVWTHSSHSQGLRTQIANTLGVPVEKVVVRWLDHSGQYGRTTLGGDGAEGDAVILSHLTGKPVRVQWTLQEDLAWSSVSPGWVCNLKAGIDRNGKLIAFENASYSPHQMDARLLGAILAGMPVATSTEKNFVASEWHYDKVARWEEAYGMPNVAANSPNGGLRGNIMRTPGQRQQVFANECLWNEAAAAAGRDPVQFRIDCTSESRLIDILQATAKAAGWEPRPSPHAKARKSGNDSVTGRGICSLGRNNAFWVGIAEIELVPDTGVVKVTRFTIGLDCGKVINPRQLDRVMRSGVVMGLSEAMKEEVTFDKSRVTSTNWSRYKILTMEEMPEIQVVQLSRDDKGFGGGSEAANALVPAAVAAAIYDATGVPVRRLPMTPEYVAGLMKA
jgi:CO/xanthine dehydrogenase Mo-binding subunit